MVINIFLGESCSHTIRPGVFWKAIVENDIRFRAVISLHTFQDDVLQTILVFAFTESFKWGWSSDRPKTRFSITIPWSYDGRQVKFLLCHISSCWLSPYYGSHFLVFQSLYRDQTNLFYQEQTWNSGVQTHTCLNCNKEFFASTFVFSVLKWLVTTPWKTPFTFHL